MATQKDFKIKKGLVVTEDIELGHATDTTIARSSAGVITVEGTTVLLSGAALGTPASGALTNCTALPAAQVAQGTMASGMVLVAPALGTPASGVMTNATGTASGLTAGTVTTNANLTGEVTSSGNAATIADNIVDEANLKVSNSPTNGYMLTAQSGNTGGLTWAAAGGGGGIDGSGTANSVPKWSDSDTLTDSKITEPNSYTTMVSGSGGIMLDIKATDGNEPNLRFLNSSAAGWYIQQDSDGNKLYIKKKGNSAKRFAFTTTDFNIYDDDSSNDVVFNVDTAAGQVQGANGTAGAPTYSFASDTNCGMFRLASDTIGFAVGGSAAMYMQASKVEANKVFEILAGSASAPSLAMKDDSNTGIYKPGADQIGFSTAGALALTIGSSGEITIPGQMTSRANVVAVTGNTVLTQAQSGSYVYWTAGTLTLPVNTLAGTHFTIFNDTGSSATVLFSSGEAVASGWGHDAVADTDATSYVCVATDTWVQVGA